MTIVFLELSPILSSSHLSFLYTCCSTWVADSSVGCIHNPSVMPWRFGLWELDFSGFIFEMGRDLVERVGADFWFFLIFRFAFFFLIFFCLEFSDGAQNLEYLTEPSCFLNVSARYRQYNVVLYTRDSRMY